MAPSSILSATPRPLRRQDRGEDRLGAGLDRDRAAHRRHQLGAGAALAGDQQRMRDHRLDQPPRRASRAPARGRAGRPSAPSRARGRAPSWRSSAPSSRRCPSRGSSAPHISSKAARTARCTGWSISTYSGPPPSRRFSVRKPACLPEQLLCSWHGGAALVAQPVRARRASSGTCGPQRRSGSPRPRSASQRATRVDVHRRARVRGAGERELLAGQAVAGAALEQRQRLQHLAGRARQDHRVGVAPGGADRAARVADHRVAAVVRLGDVAAPDLDHRHRVSHPRTPPPDRRPVCACSRRKASRIRDLTVPSGRPSRAAISAWLNPRRRRRPAPAAAPAAGRRAPRAAAPRARRRRARRSRRARPRAATAGRAGRAPAGRRGGRRRCAGCGRWRRSRSRPRRAPGRRSSARRQTATITSWAISSASPARGAGAHHEGLDPPGIALEQRNEGRRGRRRPPPRSARRRSSAAAGRRGGHRASVLQPATARPRRHGSVKAAQGAGKSPACRARVVPAIETKTSLTAACFRTAVRAPERAR